MKVTIDIDLTPSELREAMGLPDVKSVQDRWMGKMEDALLEEIEKLSPESIAKQWAGALAPSGEMLSTFLTMFSGAAGGSKK